MKDKYGRIAVYFSQCIKEKILYLFTLYSINMYVAIALTLIARIM